MTVEHQLKVNLEDLLQRKANDEGVEFPPKPTYSDPGHVEQRDVQSCELLVYVKTLTIGPTCDLRGDSKEKRNDPKFYEATFKYEKSETCLSFKKLGIDNFLKVLFYVQVPRELREQFLITGVFTREQDGSVFHYQFFGCSPSQLRKGTCVLYNATLLGAHNDVVSKFGNFEKIKVVAKRSARIGLLVSSSTPLAQLTGRQIKRIEDVEDKKYNFTDGCGFISHGVAHEITEKLGIEYRYAHQEHKVPSVYQIRLLGCKGILILNPQVANGIQIRPSLEKFSWKNSNFPPPHDLCIVDEGTAVSEPYSYGKLNKQYICLLSELGVPDEVFLKKQEEYFEELLVMEHDPWLQIKYLGAFKTKYEFAPEIIEKILRREDISEHYRGIIRNLMFHPLKIREPTLLGVKSEKTDAERLKIPIENSRNVFGVSDPSGNLEYGECFFQPTIRGRAQVLKEMYCIVGKNPCYYPGDIRKLKCVDIPDCHHLVDCLVYPVNGPRPHSNEIAGSDLDGDKYFICWDQDLIPPRIEDPTSYDVGTEAKPKKEITQEDLLKHFSNYRPQENVLNRLFVEWADVKGIGSKECRAIANLFNVAVDAAKTGKPVNIPDYLAKGPGNMEPVKTFVWMTLEERAKQYVSDLQQYMDMNKKEEMVGCLDSDEILELVMDKSSCLSEHQLFRCIVNWCKHNKAKGVLKELLRYVDFSKMSTANRLCAMMDLSYWGNEIDTRIVNNALYQSEILSERDIELLEGKASQYHWTLYYRSMVGDTLSWVVLNDVLATPLFKLLVFKMDIGGEDWVVALSISQRLRVKDTTPVTEEKVKCKARAFVSVHKAWIDNRMTELPNKSVISLDGNRLQIYACTRADRSDTFICIMDLEREGGTGISVALQKFDAGFPVTHNARMRREKILSVEVFVRHEPSFTAPAIYLPDVLEISRDKNFQHMGSTLALSNFLEKAFKEKKISYVEKEMSQLELIAVKHMEKLSDDIMEKANREQKQLSVEDLEPLFSLMGRCRQIQADVAVKIEALTHKHGIFFGSRKHYLDLTEALLQSQGKVTTCIKRLWKKLEQEDEVELFTVEEMCSMLDVMIYEGRNLELLMEVLHLIKEGGIPLDETKFCPDSKSYFCYWLALVTMELLEDKKIFLQNLIRTGDEEAMRGHVLFSNKNGDVPVNLLGSPDTPRGTDGLVLTPLVKEFPVKNEDEKVQKMLETKGEEDFPTLEEAKLVNWMPSEDDDEDAMYLDRNRNLLPRVYVEVQRLEGLLVYVKVTWPESGNTEHDILCTDRFIHQFNEDVVWRVDIFTNLVTYRRMRQALISATTGNSPKWKDSVLFLLVPNFVPANDNDEKPVETCSSQSEHAADKECAQQLLETPSVAGQWKYKEQAEELFKTNLEKLNQSQRKAVAAARDQKITVIQGPPGTGKTFTSAIIILQWLMNQKSQILVATETNEGVNNIIRKCLDVGIDEQQIVRVGVTEKTQEDIRHVTLEERYMRKCKKRLDREPDKGISLSESLKLVKNSRVVFSTLCGSGEMVLKKLNFRCVLIDEAAQALEPACVIPLILGAQQLCLVGDDQQLPPLVRNKNECKGLEIPLFARLRAEGNPVHMLDTQYRMHKSIASFSSEEFYDRKLRTGVSEADRPLPSGFSWPSEDCHVAFVNIWASEGYEGTSKFNVKETDEVAKIVKNLISSGNFKPEDIGVITPYKAQQKKINDALKSAGVKVSTVDGFQGQEREVIIFSAVRTDCGSQLDFLGNPNRMNVMLTRARRGLIVVGNKKALSKNPLWNKWLLWAKDKNIVVDNSNQGIERENARKIGDAATPRNQGEENSQQRRGGTRGRNDTYRRGGRRGYQSNAFRGRGNYEINRRWRETNRYDEADGSGDGQKDFRGRGRQENGNYHNRGQRGYRPREFHRGGGSNRDNIFCGTHVLSEAYTNVCTYL